MGSFDVPDRRLESPVHSDTDFITPGASVRSRTRITASTPGPGGCIQRANEARNPAGDETSCDSPFSRI